MKNKKTLNGYFKKDDYHNNNITGIAIHPVWWAKQYEYPWAYQFLKKRMTVADMGCGFYESAFKDILATKAEKVYAVDISPRVQKLPLNKNNIDFITADFSESISKIDEGSLDLIFLLDVLNESFDPEKAFFQFKKMLKDDGLIILTFKIPADNDGLLQKYIKFFKQNRLELFGESDFSTDKRLIHPDTNQADFHCVLKYLLY